MSTHVLAASPSSGAAPAAWPPRCRSTRPATTSCSSSATPRHARPATSSTCGHRPSRPSVCSASTPPTSVRRARSEFRRVDGRVARRGQPPRRRRPRLRRRLHRVAAARAVRAAARRAPARRAAGEPRRRSHRARRPLGPAAPHRRQRPGGRRRGRCRRHRLAGPARRCGATRPSASTTSTSSAGYTFADGLDAPTAGASCRTTARRRAAGPRSATRVVTASSGGR